MSQYDPKKIEELQLILMKNPRSPVFAGLAEAYRQMGLLEEALEVTTKGVKHNPDYVSGLVAHAKVLYGLKDYRQALHFLSKAHGMKPENILALRILGHCHLKLRQHKEALSVFKKLLILAPNDENAIQFVRKWEFLDNLAPGSPTTFDIDGYDHWVKQLPSEQHVLHLIDSFVNYGDRENALEVANTALLHWTDSVKIRQRQQLLLESESDEPFAEPENQESTTPPVAETADSGNPTLRRLQFKKAFYQQWLQRIEQRKNIDPQ